MPPSPFFSPPSTQVEGGAAVGSAPLVLRIDNERKQAVFPTICMANIFQKTSRDFDAGRICKWTVISGMDERLTV